VEIDPIRSSSHAEQDKSAHYSGKNSQSRLTSTATVQKPGPEIAWAAEQLGLGAYEIKPLCTVKHSITRYRITLEAFVTRLKDSPIKTGGLWKTPAQIQQLAFTAAHKKLASAAFSCILSAR
jgi:hypothetical protein